MIIRLATEADDIQACVALDHGFVTEHVWQMEAREQAGGMQVSFRKARLPRTLHGRYPRSLAGASILRHTVVNVTVR